MLSRRDRFISDSMLGSKCERLNARVSASVVASLSSSVVRKAWPTQWASTTAACSCSTENAPIDADDIDITPRIRSPASSGTEMIDRAS